MLVEIRCSDFKTGDNSITFHAGLNTVLGSGNSVGKTTFLTAIDFVLGGNEYTKLADIRSRFQAKQHKVYFTFKFDDGLHRFSRDFKNSSTVNYYGDNYKNNPQSMQLADYQHFLFEHYHMDVIETTFHSIVMRYFRLGDIFPKNPLKATANETKDESMGELLKLFNFYDSRDDFERIKSLKDEESKTNKVYRIFKSVEELVSSGVADFPGFSGIQAMTPLEREVNRKQIIELKDELTKLTKDGTSYDEIATKSQAYEYRDEMERRQRSLIRQKNYLIEKQRKNDEYLGIKSMSLDDDFSGLTEFFPAANIKHVDEIQSFHRKLQAILKEEFASARSYYVSAISAVQADIDSLDKQIANFNEEHKLSNISGKTIGRAAEIGTEISNLRQQNAGYDKSEGLEYDHTEALRKLRPDTAEPLKELQTAINTEMATINEELCGSFQTSPVLKISDIGSYDFKVPNDRGKGTALRGLIVFDLCVLHKTTLPIIAHDDDVLEPILGEQFKHIISAYRSTSEMKPQKQVFIALNDKGNLGDSLDGTVVLKLSEDKGSLYGEAWNTKGNTQITLDDLE